jgi:hypothetical protein
VQFNKTAKISDQNHQHVTPNAQKVHRQTEKGTAIKRMTRLVWEQINGSIIKSLWKEINEP